MKLIIFSCKYLLLRCKFHLVSSIEEPPSSKGVRTMEEEVVEQLQSAVLHSASAEATTIGEGISKMYIVCCVCTCAAIIVSWPQNIYYYVPCLTEAECESGDQQEVVHLSASSSPATGSSRDCHSEKASLHVADSDEVHAV